MDKYPESWAVLVDNGYQGALEFCRVIHPTKKPPHAVMPPADFRRNRLISSDRIIFENVFGRLCGIWNVMGLIGSGTKNRVILFQIVLGTYQFPY